jgi:hypothetical protein
MQSFDPFLLCHQIPRECPQLGRQRRPELQNPYLMRHTVRCTQNQASKVLWAYREESTYFPRGVKKLLRKDLGILQILELILSLILGECGDSAYSTHSCCMENSCVMIFLIGIEM